MLLEGRVKEALIRLNPEIEADPDEADEVHLPPAGDPDRRAHEPASGGRQRGVHGLAHRAEIDAFRPERRAHHGPADRLRRPEDDSSNQWMISTEVTFKQGRVEKRFDLVLWCNGFPLVVGEAKTPVRPAYTWIDGAAQIHDDYEQNVPQFFVPNVFSFATEGKDFRYGSVGMPVELWGPWREEETDPDAPAKIGLSAVEGGRRRRPQARGRAGLPPLLHGLRHRQASTARSRSSPGTSSSRQPT